MKNIFTNFNQRSKSAIYVNFNPLKLKKTKNIKEIKNDIYYNLQKLKKNS